MDSECGVVALSTVWRGSFRYHASSHGTSSHWEEGWLTFWRPCFWALDVHGFVNARVWAAAWQLSLLPVLWSCASALWLVNQAPHHGGLPCYVSVLHFPAQPWFSFYCCFVRHCHVFRVFSTAPTVRFQWSCLLTVFLFYSYWVVS